MARSHRTKRRPAEGVSQALSRLAGRLSPISMAILAVLYARPSAAEPDAGDFGGGGAGGDW